MMVREFVFYCVINIVSKGDFMTKNETHKEKMMRKKMERKNSGTNGDTNTGSSNRPNDELLELMKMVSKGGGTVIINRPNSMPDLDTSIEFDPNRVVIGENLKSRFYNDNVEMKLEEEFIGGFKTLRNDPFFASVILDKGSMNGVEKELKNDTERFWHSTGDFTRIKHLTYWSEEYECFLAWRCVPENVEKTSFGYTLDLKEVA
jgi:hypothetical protein